MLSLNPLLLSKKVLQHKDLFVDTYTDLINASKGLFHLAEKYHVEIDTSLIPICLLPSNKIDDLKNKHSFKTFRANVYNDKMGSDYTTNCNDRTYLNDCHICKLKNVCAGFPDSYISFWKDLKEIQPI